jgi:nucleoside-diphosphate-sugar epimerase
MILVTGGTGFIGSHLLFHLTSSGEKVKALKRAESSTDLTSKIFSYYSDDPQKLMKKIEWVDGDLLDYFSLFDALKGIKQLYHVAAAVSFHSNDKENVIRTNVDGTANLVNAALDQKVSKLCFVSSIGALGRAVSIGLVTEETEFQPSSKNSVYSTSKYESEKEVWRGMAEGLDVVVVNPSIVVGPGNWNAGSPQLFQTMWNGLKFYSVGTNGFVDVNDVAKALVLIMNGPFSGERFILSAENITYKQFFEWMAEAMKMPTPKIKAGLFLSAIGWRVLKVKSLLTGSRSGITKETSKTANQVYRYSNKKVIEATRIRFVPVKESIEKTAALFLSEQQ